MKKIITLLSLGVLALAGCDAGNANAQNSTTSVGNPESENIMVLEQGYEVVAPSPASNVQNDMNANQRTADWTNEGNVEVAPQPANTNGNVNNPAMGQISSPPTSPDIAVYEAEETVVQQ